MSVPLLESKVISWLDLQAMPTDINPPAPVVFFALDSGVSASHVWTENMTATLMAYRQLEHPVVVHLETYQPIILHKHTRQYEMEASMPNTWRILTYCA